MSAPDDGQAVVSECMQRGISLTLVLHEEENRIPLHSLTFKSITLPPADIASGRGCSLSVVVISVFLPVPAVPVVPDPQYGSTNYCNFKLFSSQATGLGVECRQASEYTEKTRGHRTNGQLTAEFHQRVGQRQTSQQDNN